jgi:hypothetical protein
VNRLLPAPLREAFGDSDDSYPRLVMKRENLPNFYGVVTLKGLEDLTMSLRSYTGWVASDTAVVNSYLDHAAETTPTTPCPKPDRPGSPAVESGNGAAGAFMKKAGWAGSNVSRHEVAGIQLSYS